MKRLDFELTKLSEECGEVVQICSKTVIWGVENFNPKTKQTNREALIEEMAQVLSHIDRVCEYLNINKEELLEEGRLKNIKMDKYYVIGNDTVINKE